ncbi:hypothetical protein JKA74_18160 [Marivirga sp. S37H4]|uniref:PepSY domain-containing protein n=1 Tax=Marivirga aurantiaca TaxID=2802615 RepID=A0A934X1J3_9BACT|nr:hypothetical protein [Marivirga aurantiaca]MBK6266974.1 hypothetical protein [Marivirga aurantiaca]
MKLKIYHSLISKFIIYTCLFVLAEKSIAQEVKEKYEKEISIKKDDFPENSLQLVAPILKKGEKTRLYKEFNGKDYFYELKTHYKGEKVSVKFYENGQLLDIEILKNFHDLAPEIQERINQYFQENYKKYIIHRIQIQYNREREFEDGKLEIDEDDEFLEEFMEMDLEDLIVKFEIEAETVDYSNERSFFEFLFDHSGEIERKRTIVKRADDNVLY